MSLTSNETDFVFDFRHSKAKPGTVRTTECRAFKRTEFDLWLQRVRSTEKGSDARQAVLEQRPLPVAFGMSLCHPRDNFSKKLGRDKSKGRAIQELQRQALYLF